MLRRTMVSCAVGLGLLVAMNVGYASDATMPVYAEGGDGGGDVELGTALDGGIMGLCGSGGGAPAVDDPCSFIDSLEVTCDLERSLLKAKVRSDLPPCTRLRLVADDTFYRNARVHWNGRARAAWRNPMPGLHEVCIEGCDICASIMCGCAGDTDCDDGLFCNGAETCDIDTGECIDGENPCGDDQVCDEANDQCDVVIETVTIGNPGNGGEPSGGSGGIPQRICGAVDYVYNIGKFEVTAGQYTEVLNAVASEDTYGLYNTEMWTNEFGCKIERTGSSPNYSYSVAAEWADRPVNYVSWGDAARFANWLHNGQPTGAQDLSTTEDGSYFLDGAMSDAELLAVVRKDDATWVIPLEDELYKSAYHENDGPTDNYFEYATSHDTAPVAEPCPGGDNSVNYAYAVGAPYYRNEVGCFIDSVSPYGTFDQGGNVWEWNEQLMVGGARGTSGGSYNDTAVHVHAIHRNGAPPTLEIGTVGFRVARVGARAGW